MSIAQLVQADSLTWQNKSNAFSIFSFTLTIEKNGQTQELKAESNRFTPEMKNVFQSLHSGDWFLIENIKVLGKDEKWRLFSPLYLKIE